MVVIDEDDFCLRVHMLLPINYPHFVKYFCLVELDVCAIAVCIPFYLNS